MLNDVGEFQLEEYRWFSVRSAPFKRPGILRTFGTDGVYWKRSGGKGIGVQTKWLVETMASAPNKQITGTVEAEHIGKSSDILYESVCQ